MAPQVKDPSAYRNLIRNGKLEKAVDDLIEQTEHYLRNNSEFLETIGKLSDALTTYAAELNRITKTKMQGSKTQDYLDSKQVEISNEVLGIIRQLPPTFWKAEDQTNPESPVPAGSVDLRGKVTNFQVASYASEGRDDILQWNFTVLLDEAPGNPVEVEMSAPKFSGIIQKNDIVMLPKLPAKGTVLQTSIIFNVTRGIYVRGKNQRARRMLRSLWDQFYVVFILMIVAALYGLYTLITGM